MVLVPFDIFLFETFAAKSFAKPLFTCTCPFGPLAYSTEIRRIDVSDTPFDVAHGPRQPML